MKMVPTIALSLALSATAAFAQEGAGDIVIEGSAHPIPATITLPEGEGPFPFVVMFHGTGSDRHEAGGGYDLLAPALAEAGIASARFDFAGNGDSTVDYADYTLTGGMQDGLEVIDYMRGLDAIDDDRLGLLGWSQGGTIAMLTAARNPGVSSVATWAGAVDMSGYAPEEYEEAEANGFAVIEFDWRTPLNRSLAWYDEVASIDIAAELAAYDGAILAIAGANDDVVLPEVAETIVSAATASDNAALEIVPGADHTFNIFTGDMAAFDQLIAITVEWFSDTL